MQHHYASLQCHMIFHKSFYADLLKKHFLLLSMLKTFVLLIIVLKLRFISKVFQKFKRTAFIWNRIFCKIIKAVTVIFDQFN